MCYLKINPRKCCGCVSNCVCTMGAGEEEWNHICPIMEVELGPFFIQHQEYQLSFSSTMNPPAILGMLYFQKLHQQPLGGVIIAFHLANLANLMTGWQMWKRTSKESHKLQSCACSHCAWNTVCIVYTYDIGINCPSGGIGFEHLDRRNIFLHPLSARYLPIAKLSLPSLKVMKVQVHRPFRFHAGYSTHNWDHHCNCQLENVFTGSSIPLQSRNLFLTLEYATEQDVKNDKEHQLSQWELSSSLIERERYVAWRKDNAFLSSLNMHTCLTKLHVFMSPGHILMGHTSTTHLNTSVLPAGR